MGGKCLVIQVKKFGDDSDLFSIVGEKGKHSERTHYLSSFEHPDFCPTLCMVSRSTAR